MYPVKTIVISINASWNIVNFRKGLIAELQKAGYHVVAVAPDDHFSRQLAELRVDFVPIKMDKKGISPLRDVLLLWRYFRVLARIRPVAFLGYTAKPNVYGSLAAQWLHIPVINNVAGLGTAYIRGGWLARIVSTLYKIAFRRSAIVFFQNRDDRELFVSGGILRNEKARLLPGSGIDLAAFNGSPKTASGEFRFLLIGRLLRDKGVYEYVEAARIVREKIPDVRFQLLGFLDVENRTAITRAEVDEWVSQGLIEYLGEAEDVRPHVEAADCIVLPSYREGLPRVLLEGAAMAKPLIATDVPGCRHVVEDGRNGFLCPAQDGAALGRAMLRMLELPEQRRRDFGLMGRSKVETEFDERIVFRSYLEAIMESTRSDRN